MRVDRRTARGGERRTVSRSSARRTLGALHTDRTKLKQSLLNLLSNASKFTEEGTRHARSQPAPRRDLVQSVSDTGIGMTEEQHRPAVPGLQPGRRVDHPAIRRHRASASRSPSISARCWAATITVESAPGQGSTFTITLPDRAPRREPLPPRPPTGAEHARAGHGGRRRSERPRPPRCDGRAGRATA